MQTVKTVIFALGFIQCLRLFCGNGWRLSSLRIFDSNFTYISTHFIISSVSLARVGNQLAANHIDAKEKGKSHPLPS